MRFIAVCYITDSDKSHFNIVNFTKHKIENYQLAGGFKVTDKNIETQNINCRLLLSTMIKS